MKRKGLKLSPCGLSCYNTLKKKIDPNKGLESSRYRLISQKKKDREEEEINPNTLFNERKVGRASGVREKQRESFLYWGWDICFLFFCIKLDTHTHVKREKRL